METDPGIETFRQTLERHNTIISQLQTLAITILRADELPGLIQRSDGLDARWLREEQTALGHPVRLRIRRSQLDNELRQANSVIGEQLRAALDAITDMVTAAAGGPDAAMSPFVRRHLAELAKNRSAPPVPATQASRQRRFAIALRDIDASLAALQEIRSEVRQTVGSR
jgi:hypothetical protein